MNIITPPSVAIIGGGLAGLNAARLLHRAGIAFQLFESRDRLGGRILTVDEAGIPAEDGFDLGPSWFWPEVQPAIGTLAVELGLRAFVQHSRGDSLLERSAREQPLRFPGMAQQPAAVAKFLSLASRPISRAGRILPPSLLRITTASREEAATSRNRASSSCSIGPTIWMISMPPPPPSGILRISAAEASVMVHKARPMPIINKERKRHISLHSQAVANRDLVRCMVARFAHIRKSTHRYAELVGLVSSGRLKILHQLGDRSA